MPRRVETRVFAILGQNVGDALMIASLFVAKISLVLRLLSLRILRMPGDATDQAVTESDESAESAGWGPWWRGRWWGLLLLSDVLIVAVMLTVHWASAWIEPESGRELGLFDEISFRCGVLLFVLMTVVAYLSDSSRIDKKSSRTRIGFFNGIGRSISIFPCARYDYGELYEQKEPSSNTESVSKEWRTMAQRVETDAAMFKRRSTHE
jgi:hypothetical protein